MKKAYYVVGRTGLLTYVERKLHSTFDVFSDNMGNLTKEIQLFI